MSETTDNFRSVKVIPPQNDDLMGFLFQKETERAARLRILEEKWQELQTSQDISSMRSFAKDVTAGLNVDILLREISKAAANHLRTEVFIDKTRRAEPGTPQIGQIIDGFIDKASVGTKMEKIRALTGRLERYEKMTDEGLAGNNNEIGHLPEFKIAIGEALAAMEYMDDHMYTNYFQHMVTEIGTIEDQITLHQVLSHAPELLTAKP